MSGGATHADRLPDAFRGEGFRVDETSLEQSLVMTWELAKHLRMVGADGGAPSGHWGPLLEHDESVLIARIQALDLERDAAAFLDNFAAAQPAQMVEQLRDLATWVEDWAAALRAADVGRVSLLAERASKILQNYQQRAPTPPMPLRGTTERPPPPDADPKTLDSLRSAYFALSSAVEDMAVLARGLWADSLTSQRHEPGAALVVAFCQLLSRVQAQINRFAGRLTDFYYHDVLHMRPRPAEPDSTHLVFQRDPTYGGPVEIAAGAPFVVPQASGEPITFLAATALRVTDHKVEDLRTLRQQRDSLITPEAHFDFVTAIKAETISAGALADSDDRQTSFALLGPDARGEHAQGEDARLGLALSSPVLWLAEGERRISIELFFDFGGETLQQVRRALLLACRAGDPALFSRALGRLFARWVVADLGRSTMPTLRYMRRLARRFVADVDSFRVRAGVVDDGGDGLFDGERYSPTDPFILLLARSEPDRPDDSRRELIRDEVVENLFRVALSKADGDGWHQIYRPVMGGTERRLTDGRATLKLVVELANEDPPIVACTPELHGPEWETAAPTVRLTLNRSSGVFPASLLAETVLHAVEIAVEVKGLRQVQAFNQLGALDPTRPFMPFGPLPTTASYLVVGAPEIAGKKVTRVELRPEWSGLPPRGFSYYYAEYEGEYGAGAYTTQASVLRDGRWAPAGRPRRLFDEGAPPVGRTVSVDPHELQARWRPTAGDFAAAPSARNGLIKLQLAAPEGGFGHQEYPEALTAAVSAKAKDKKARPLPNPPYTPMIERLTLDYEARTRMELGVAGAALAAEGEAILHLYPFGYDRVHPRRSERPVAVVPQVQRDGNLYIGLSGSPPQGPVTLFFDLRRAAAVDALALRDTPPVLEWAWLRGDRWQPLEPHRVLSDTTKGFLAPGIVSLDLPSGMDLDHWIMPSGRYWLRLSSDAASGAFAGVKAVQAQALRAERQLTAAAAAPAFDLRNPASSPLPGLAFSHVTSDGEFHIAVSRHLPPGPITLLFELQRVGVEVAPSAVPPPLAWEWRDGDHWRPLEPERILADSTRRFQVSGAMTLDVPSDPARADRVTTAGWYWLRLSCPTDRGYFAPLKAARLQVVRAETDVGPRALDTPLPARSISLHSAPMPGLLAIEQPDPGFDLRPAESLEAFRARAGERLRHKQRAATPWDYERLVLERFPYVHKVRCLPNRRVDRGGRCPGDVLVVAIPKTPRNDARYLTRRMRLDPLQLKEIRAYLQGLASPGVRVQVRNASFDLVQVRCRVELEPNADIGEALRRINTAIIERLSPWCDVGGGGSFDWRVRAEDVESWVRGAGAVRSVRGVSLIHVWEDPAEPQRPPFRFRDTAVGQGPAAIAFLYPWSLALPMDEHFIEVDGGTLADGPRATGVMRRHELGAPESVAGIAIGRTFVVGGPI